MNFTQLRNKDGQFVAPSEESFKAAAAHADWDKAPGFCEILTNEIREGQLADYRRDFHP